MDIEDPYGSAAMIPMSDETLARQREQRSMLKVSKRIRGRPRMAELQQTDEELDAAVQDHVQWEKQQQQIAALVPPAVYAGPNTRRSSCCSDPSQSLKQRLWRQLGPVTTSMPVLVVPEAQQGSCSKVNTSAQQCASATKPIFQHTLDADTKWQLPWQGAPSVLSKLNFPGRDLQVGPLFFQGRPGGWSGEEGPIRESPLQTTHLQYSGGSSKQHNRKSGQ